jgi:hypothetical protein
MLTMIVVIVATSIGDAQDEQRGRRGRFGGGRGFGFGAGPGAVDMLRLAQIEKVQQEVEMQADQVTKVQALAEEQRGNRGGGRRGGFQGFQDLSDEERRERIAEFQRQAEERTKEVETKLADILLPHQFARVKQIQLQVQGANALQNSEVAAKLELTDAQKADIERISRENTQSMFEQMGELRGQDNFREKVDELRKEGEKKVLAVLNATQQQQFEEMKGAAFELPPDALGGGRRGGGRRGGPGGGNRGGRPDA